MPPRAQAAASLAPVDEREREFSALYRAHFGYAWRTLARYGVPRASLEDAAQEVFMIVLRRFGTWSGRASFRAWLHGVARRVASAQRRRQHRHQRKLEALDQRGEPPRVALDQQLDERRRLDALAEAIERLEPRRREVFVLTELEGLSAPEIADALGCKLNTVYSRLRRARADINREMAAHYGADHG
ncbi:RNA polymerase sigma factor [Pseudenhygromyxa sp. WMMC2535]|uniref:RNA polymerase sigma factor n=1 Tax=Pseudenhygromyxa sp. WMMC2535 TaxID=2712867 RepID=UPI00155435D1|nr:RNA polymerase sigma factor [Pseudenhygromyxa sp. WMMC2535]NVB42305.1 RNA polymerase sigma factor [Pseudenhygromyxa sp. WMMC2535]